MPTLDDLSRIGVTERVWQKYCGFLDLSIADFMEIQENLLLEQLSLVSGSQLGRKILGASQPTTVDDFRRTVPITTYADYQPYLGERQDDALSEKPLWWVYTSAQSGSCKWAPFTERAVDRLLDTMMGALILAAASRKGEVNIQTGARALFNMAPRPYLAGYLTLGM
ncbi:MAG: GH3 auxin-responsive promoter family protein, partial [Chloroflexota bacterium]